MQAGKNGRPPSENDSGEHKKVASFLGELIADTQTVIGND